MFSTGSIAGALAALVHPDKRADPAQFLRHRAFIAGRLALSFSAALLAPVLLALRGAPTIAEAVAFGWLMFPLIAALFVSRTGDLSNAQRIHMTGLVGLSTTLALGGASAAAALWLILLPVEAAFLHSRASIAAAAAIALLAALVMMASPFGATATAPIAEIAAFVIPAVVYVTFLALSSRRLQHLSRRQAIAGDARYRLLAETVGDLVMRLDRGGAVVYASNGGDDVLHLSARDVAGRGFFERVHVADRPAYLKAVAEAAQPGGASHVMLRVSEGSARRDGAAASAFAPSVFAAPVFAWAELRCRHADADLDFADGAQVVCLMRDVTAAKQREEELERMRQAAERANMWKDRFLANVSHELRTPLNAIIGFSDMLRDPSLAPTDARRQREYAGIIRESGEHLLSMVNSLLDISKIEAGCFEIAPESVTLAPLIDSVVEMMRLKAEQGGVRIAVEIDARIGEIVADKRACRQILINLLSNAVKFTPEGGRVCVRARPEGNSIALEVLDDGIGIDALDMARLGDAFYQARSAYDRPYEGTGLGLSLVRGLVGLHGGAITIESAPGEGTCVSVRLPLDCRAAEADSAPARIETVVRRLLVERPGASALLEPARKIA